MFKGLLRCAFWCVLLAIGTAAPAAPHKVRVNDPALAKFLVARGGRLIADYDTFQIIETDDASVVGADVTHAQSADNLNFIELNARPLDTRAPEIQARRQTAGVFSGKHLRLIQFAGPVKPEWFAALEQHGARIIDYIPQNAYLIYGDAPALARMQAWARTASHVQWEGDYANDYKVHPRARPTDANGKTQSPTTDMFTVQLVDDADANPATLALIDALKLAPIKTQYRSLRFLNVIVRLPAAQLDLIAAQPEVVSIQPYFENEKFDERQDQIMAGNLTSNAPTAPGYLAWLAGKGFTQAQFDASGFVVDISDSGVDNGSTSPGHFGFYALGDPGLASRIVYNRLQGTAHGGSTLAGCDGHGTLNAHIIGGYNNFASGFPHTDAAGYCYGLGICPFVKIGSSVIFDPSTFTSPNIPKLQSEAYHDGARISANSWGANVAGAYNSDSQTYDAMVRDAQPVGSSFPTAGNQQMVIVFASGNAGPGAQTVGSPGTGKNVITVGASENVRSLSTTNGGYDAAGDSRCVNDPDTVANNADDMGDFSSRGPCADGRKKPDLVAPGTHITGGVAQSGSPTTNGVGVAIACFDAEGVCALPGAGTVGSPANFFPLGQQFYTVSSGTSHSTPAVAGACALLRQYFINQSLTPPSPAMTKAYLMNSTRYLTGVGANDTLWSTGQGMGEVNLGAAFDASPRVLRDQETTNKFTATGQTRTFTGTISDPAKPFRVTLAWTDAPGSTSGNAFNNDLDLTVTVGGNTYKGNAFSGAFSATGGVADNKNNVESVFLPAGLSATFTVTVSAANIVSDGVPNEAPALDQDFALVIYNAVEGPVPVIKADSFAVIAESCSSPNNAIDPGETVTVRFALKNTGSADTTNLVVTLLETNGVMAPSTPQVYGALVAGGAAVTQSFSFTATGVCGGSINPLLRLQDGTTLLGTASIAIQLGQTAVIFSENFDGVTSPTLPQNWTTSASGAQSPFTTQVSVTDTLPNAAFSPDPGAVGVNQLVSPPILLTAGQNQLSFRNNYVLEAGPGTIAYDGAVLEIKIGMGAFTDILSAGGNFVTGGYNRIINSGFANPLAGRQAWSGNSGPPILTTVDLPPAASGQTIQLRWRCATDSSVSDSGWRVDTIVINGAVCCYTATANLTIGESPAPVIVSVGSNLTSVIVVTNLGPQTANAVTMTDTLPPGLDFVSASSSQGTCTNDGALITCNLGALANGAGASISIQATATTIGSWTNIATVWSTTPDPITANNTVTAVITVNSPPTLSTITDQTTDEDTPLGPVAFTIGDVETPAAALTLSAVSSDPTLIAPANIVFGGSGTNRNLSLTPATNQNGICTITITVSDGTDSVSNSFAVIVNPINDPPVLDPMPNRTVHVGTTLTFTSTASDIDQPPDALTFTLASNSPAGATIDLGSGVFSWTPDNSFLNTTNHITVEVTDNGTPPLSDAKSFTVTVIPPPMVQSINISGGMVSMVWSAISGQTYRVQFKDNLDDAVWTDLWPEVTAVGSTASQDDVFSVDQRFYRIIVVQ